MKSLTSSTESNDPDNAGLGIIRDLYVLLPHMHTAMRSTHAACTHARIHTHALTHARTQHGYYHSSNTITPTCLFECMRLTISTQTSQHSTAHLTQQLHIHNHIIQ